MYIRGRYTLYPSCDAVYHAFVSVTIYVVIGFQYKVLCHGDVQEILLECRELDSGPSKS